MFNLTTANVILKLNDTRCRARCPLCALPYERAGKISLTDDARRRQGPLSVPRHSTLHHPLMRSLTHHLSSSPTVVVCPPSAPGPPKSFSSLETLPPPFSHAFNPLNSRPPHLAHLCFTFYLFPSSFGHFFSPWLCTLQLAVMSRYRLCYRHCNCP